MKKFWTVILCLAVSICVCMTVAASPADIIKGMLEKASQMQNQGQEEGQGGDTETGIEPGNQTAAPDVQNIGPDTGDVQNAGDDQNAGPDTGDVQNAGDDQKTGTDESAGQPGEEQAGNQDNKPGETPDAGQEGESAGESGETAGQEGDSGETAGQEGDSGETAGQEGDSAESAGQEGDSGESAGPEGESAGGPGGEAQQAEPEGPRIPGEAPVSTTADSYGYTDTAFNADTASGGAINAASGEQSLEGVQILYWGGSAVQVSDHAQLVVRDSYIRGETALETAPLAGNPGNLLVAGNIRTTLGLGNSQSMYINSTIVSRNWAALSTDGAKPALEAGEKELSLYAYGSEAITQDGGYGAYSDLFCNLYSYGSHIQAAEIGIISGTYGKVTIGTAEDGEADNVLSAVLTDADKAKRADKSPGSVIEGGRNAIMIHSVNLPPYWEYEGYSQEELPLLSTSINAKDSVLATNRYLDKNVTYEPQKQAYIDHTKGSVILIKSTNVDMKLDGCRLVADDEGTGYLVQTVYNNDTMFMNAVPDGEYYPGIDITMQNMDVKGDIAHEDYQRDFSLTLRNASLKGAVNEYDCEHWRQAAAKEGFTDYSLDTVYNTHHGIEVKLSDNAVWDVTKDSRLSSLIISGSAVLNGNIFVNGEQQEIKQNISYDGDILVTPLDASAAETVTEPETTTEAPAEAPTETPTEAPTETEHVHNWVSNGGSPANCYTDGRKNYICSECGAETYEVLPALAPDEGHIFEPEDINSMPATCTDEGWTYLRCIRCGTAYKEYEPAKGHNYHLAHTIDPTCYAEGERLYICDDCGSSYTETIPPSGHSWSFYYHVDPTCSNYGYDVYVCDYCGYTEAFDYDYYPPTYLHNYAIVYPTPGQESLTHTWQCTECGATYEEYHTGNYECYCGWVGAVG